MITQDDLNILEKRFYTYTDAFITGVKEPYPYSLKQDHTLRVCENSRMLAGSLHLGEGEVNLARAAALVHDLGRFPQFADYGTFSDAMSQNHGALGAGVLVRQGFLNGLLRPDRRLILRVVTLHNRPRLPRGLNCQLDRIARLIRDADKIDIYRVMKAHYQSAENGTQTFLTHNLADDGRVSRELVARLMSGLEIPYAAVSSLNDMKLFQISMVQDLNFPAAFRAVRDMGVIEAILDSMPGFSVLKTLSKTLNVYMVNKIETRVGVFS